MKSSTRKVIGRVATCAIPTILAFISAWSEQTQCDRMENVMQKMEALVKNEEK